MLLLLHHQQKNNQEVEDMLQEGDKGIAMNVGKTVLILVALMFVLIIAANVIG